MKNLAARLVRLVSGLAIISFGIAMAYVSNLGLAPWNVLNDGFSKTFPVTFGMASILIGFVILFVDILFKERIGFGTFINILLVGSIFDLIIASEILPSYLGSVGFDNLVPRLILCLLSFIPASFGLYLYMSAALGAGPRDTLMCAVTKKLPLSVGLARMILEGSALLAGWLMGGTVGIGTIILVLGNGPIMQLVFHLFKFDVKTLQNETIPETLAAFKKPEEKAG